MDEDRCDKEHCHTHPFPTSKTKDMKKIKYIIVGIISLFLLFYTYGVACPPSVPKEKVAEALAFCKKNHLSTDYAVFVDFSKHSGLKRYMIYSFNKHKVVFCCMCASGLNKDKYSNKPGSNLSSLGKYRITNQIHNMRIGREGLIIEGLESTNSNARNRMILIHYSEVLNNSPQSTFPIPIFIDGISAGCFSITSKGVHETKKLPKPMLLWAYR